MKRALFASSLLPLLFLTGCTSTEGILQRLGGGADKSASNAPVPSAATWERIIGPVELERRIREDEIVVVDARSADAYAKEHIPGAINVPGSSLRTSKAKPGQGDSQYLFRAVDGSPAISQYETLLGQAGIKRSDSVVVYGNHAGKADGTIPAMILDWLGQERVAFLDGVGLAAWSTAGFDTETTTATRPPTLYTARPSTQKFVWNLPDVLAAVASGEAAFVDTRTLGEYKGTTKRDNRNGGHIPGAIRHDYADLLDDKKCVVDKATARTQVEALAIPADKPVVLYCQTATRVSLNYLVLKELGYDKVAIYDGSWHEYGNTSGVPIEQ